MLIVFFSYGVNNIMLQIILTIITNNFKMMKQCLDIMYITFYLGYIQNQEISVHIKNQFYSLCPLAIYEC